MIQTVRIVMEAKPMTVAVPESRFHWNISISLRRNSLMVLKKMNWLVPSRRVSRGPAITLNAREFISVFLDAQLLHSGRLIRLCLPERVLECCARDDATRKCAEVDRPADR